jgi:hypothetical protein
LQATRGNGLTENAAGRGVNGRTRGERCIEFLHLEALLGEKFLIRLNLRDRVKKPCFCVFHSGKGPVSSIGKSIRAPFGLPPIIKNAHIASICNGIKFRARQNVFSRRFRFRGTQKVTLNISKVAWSLASRKVGFGTLLLSTMCNIFTITL